MLPHVFFNREAFGNVKKVDHAQKVLDYTAV